MTAFGAIKADGQIGTLPLGVQFSFSNEASGSGGFNLAQSGSSASAAASSGSSAASASSSSGEEASATVGPSLSCLSFLSIVKNQILNLDLYKNVSII